MTTLTEPILAWHNNPALKAETVARMRAHRADDDFIQGVYTRFDTAHFRGCFHGCLTAETLAAEAGLPLALFLRNDGYTEGYTDWYAEGERLWGIPRPLGALLDRVFETVPRAEASGFAVAATQAIRVGADLALVVLDFLLTLLADPDYGVRWLPAAGRPQRAAVHAAYVAYVAYVNANALGNAAKAAKAVANAVANAANAANAANDANDANAANLIGYYRWRAAKLIDLLAAAPSTKDGGDGNA